MTPENEVRLQEGLNEEQTQEAIQQMVDDHEVMIFMKGNALFPQCGFSAQVVEIFKLMGKPINTFNILENMMVREGVKKFSNWPTLPQVYYKGEFVGGCDIVTEMYQKGDLQKTLGLS